MSLLAVILLESDVVVQQRGELMNGGENRRPDVAGRRVLVPRQLRKLRGEVVVELRAELTVGDGGDDVVELAHKVAPIYPRFVASQ